MSTEAVRGAVAPSPRAIGEPCRVAFIGRRSDLHACCPLESTSSLSVARFATDGDPALDELEAFRAHASVVFEPASLPPLPAELMGVSVGLLVSGLPAGAHRGTLEQLDRLVTFEPALTGEAVAGSAIWRAIPPPISDLFYRDVVRRHGAPRALTIGRSSEHREAMLMAAKHHHDLLQLLHGVDGDRLAELLAGYDVGVYVPAEPGGGFGRQVGLHLAAGQLLLCEELVPTHGLERNIDYLQVESPDALVWVLERMRRFPEMYHRIRVRGRLKAEHFRASRVFARLVHDLLADVRAFGRTPQPR